MRTHVSIILTGVGRAGGDDDKEDGPEAALDTAGARGTDGGGGESREDGPGIVRPTYEKQILFKPIDLDRRMRKSAQNIAVGQSK